MNKTKGTNAASHTCLVKSAAAFITAIARVIFLKIQKNINKDRTSIDHAV
jgi:hypothetical protein